MRADQRHDSDPASTAAGRPADPGAGGRRRWRPRAWSSAARCCAWRAGAASSEQVAAPEGLIDAAGKATRDTVAVAVEGYEEAPRHETILFNTLTGFVGAFALMRLSTWGQKGGWWPVDPVKVQGPPHPPLRPGHPDRVRGRRGGPRDQQRAPRGGASPSPSGRASGSPSTRPRCCWTCATSTGPGRGSSRCRSASASAAVLGATLLALRILRRGEKHERPAGPHPRHGGRHQRPGGRGVSLR